MYQSVTHAPPGATPKGHQRQAERTGGPVRAAALDKNTVFRSTPSNKGPREGKPEGAERRAARYALRDGVQEWTSHERLGRCGRRRAFGAKGVDVRLCEGVAHFGGVALCGSIHVCPVCGPRVRQARALELDTALSHWTREHGAGAVLLLTLTVPHTMAMGLAMLLDIQRAGFRALTSGRFAQRLGDDFGQKFHIRALDVTHGANGWHPHFHVVLLLDAPLGKERVQELGNALFEKWRGAVKKAGLGEAQRQGFDLSPARNRTDVARYVTQMVYGGDEENEKGGRSLALEVTRGDLKAGKRSGQRTIFEILASAVRPLADADGVLDEEVERDRALWKEWEQGSAGIRAIRWSPGLREAVGLGEEQTDEETVAEEVGGKTIYEFSGDEWRAVLRARARAAVLRAAEEGGGVAVGQYVARLLAGRPSGAEVPDAVREAQRRVGGPVAALCA